MKIFTNNPRFEKQIKQELKEWADLDIDLIDYNFEARQGFAFHLEETSFPQVKLFFEDYIRPKTTNNQLLGKKKNGRIEMLAVIDVYYVEAIGRDVYAYTSLDGFQLKQKLYELDHVEGFVRINKSTIVNVLHVKSMIALLNGKLLLTLSDEQELDVSRKYVKPFKTYLRKGVVE